MLYKVVNMEAAVTVLFTNRELIHFTSHPLEENTAADD
jgi:hypothetical protein